MMQRLLMVLLLVGLIAGQAGIGSTAYFTDAEPNTGNTFEAWISSQWVQTSQTDFEAGVLDSVDTSSSPGDVKLEIVLQEPTTSVGSEESWYFTSWSCRAPVTISNPGSGLTDYQVKLNVSYDSDMQADFDDLRFTNASDTPLDYWIESKTDGSSATVWVEVDSIAASGDTTIYMYYGNVNASTTSNGTAAFYWFDNFSQDTLSNYSQFNPPTNGWGVSGGELYINMDASETLHQTTNNAPGLYFTAPSGSYISQVKIRFDGGNPNQNYESGWLYSAQGVDDYVGVSHVFWGSERRLWAYEAAAAFTNLEISGYTDDVVYVRIINLNSTYTAQYSSDGNSWSDFSGSHTVTYSPEVVALSAWSYSTATCTVYFDDLLVRKYADPEPTISVGSEDGWSRRAPVTISNPGSGLTDYQVKVDVNYDADMQPDFDDIRFKDSDGSTELSHWRESYTASTSAIFWVKVPSIPSGDKTIYMYYGNDAANSASDGDATFEFFDDFEDGDISDWSQYGSGTVQIANDGGNYVLLKTAYNDQNGGYSLFNNGALSNFEAVFRTKRINENGGSQNRYGIEDSSFNGYGPRMYDFNSLPSNFAIEQRTGGSGTNLVVKSTSAYQWNTWMTVKFRKFGDILEFELYDSTRSLVESISTSNSLYSSFDRFVVHGGWEFYTDDIRVRKYAPQSAYVSSGTIASQVLDTGVAGAKWDALFWDETLPSNTDITFEVRASNTSFAKNATTPSWTFVGGTSPVTSGLPSGRYLQWRATLTTSDTSETPTLQEVTIDYY